MERLEVIAHSLTQSMWAPLSLSLPLPPSVPCLHPCYPCCIKYPHMFTRQLLHSNPSSWLSQAEIGACSTIHPLNFVYIPFKVKAYQLIHCKSYHQFNNNFGVKKRNSTKLNSYICVSITRHTLISEKFKYEKSQA